MNNPKMLKQLLAAAAIVALIAGSELARAGSVTLLCDFANPSLGYTDSPATVTLDEQAGVVSVRMSAGHLRDPGGISGGYDGRGGWGPVTFGPVPATFTAEAITFFSDKGAGERACWSIDRLTGLLRGHVNDQCTGQNRDTWAQRMYTCHPAKAQF